MHDEERHAPPPVAAPVGDLTDGPDLSPTLDAPGSEPTMAIRNHERGQVVEVDVGGHWDDRDLEARLLRLVTLRQPARLELTVASPDEGRLPSFGAVRAALESFGGTLHLTHG